MQLEKQSVRDDFEKTKKEREELVKAKNQIEKELKEKSKRSESDLEALRLKLFEAETKIKSLQAKIDGN